MGGLFGVVSKQDCVQDLYYGTDYHSHLGTMRGGLAVKNSDEKSSEEFIRFIHNIENTQFRSKFGDDIKKMHGYKGIGVISDHDDQPLIIGSRLGKYAIATVGKINNLEKLIRKAYDKGAHLSETSGGEENPTELVSTLINQEYTFEEGIKYAQETIDGSCSMLLLTEKGVYAARDRLGRTPLIIGEKQGSHAVTSETCAFPNLDFKIKHYLGPGEIVLITPDGYEQKKKPGNDMQICTFLWVYYSYPASNCENINVEVVRNNCGKALAEEDRKDGIKIDIVAGIPDSGTGHAIGYANEAKIPFARPFTKYTPTWPRSFMPQDQKTRDLVGKMKLIPIREKIDGKRILFCEDSIVRGTQLKPIIQRLYDYGALEVHMRPACPPLIYRCKFLNFSRSKSELDLAARKAIEDMEGTGDVPLELYSDPDSEKHKAMVEQVRKEMNLTTLKYQRLDNLVKSVGLPKEKLCTYCWDGVDS